MAAIVKNFKIVLEEWQAQRIRNEFRKACEESGLDMAAMVAQPMTEETNPPAIDFAVVTPGLFRALSAVIESHRDPDAVKAMQAGAKAKEGA